MAVFSWMSAPSNASDTAYRKWAQGIHDAFVGCGWVQTDDTGQADLSTMTVPSSSGNPVHYEIFRMDDDLQSEFPVFVKIEYDGTAISGGQVWFTVGQETNGNGVLGGLLLPRQRSTSSTSTTDTEFPSYASSDGGGFVLVPWSGWTGASTFFFAVERSRSTDGSPTAEGLLIVFQCQTLASTSNVNGVRVVGNGGGGGVSIAQSRQLNVSLPGSINGQVASLTSTLSKDGVVAPVLPIPCMAPGVTPWVSNILVAVHPGDAGTTSVIQAATINGQTRTYRAWVGWNTSAGTIPLGGANSFALPAIHWEVD